MAATENRDDPRSRYNEELQRLELVTQEANPETDGPGQLRGDVDEADGDAIRGVLDALDPENRRATFSHDGEHVTHEPKTLSNYALRLRLAATETDGTLLEQDTDAINDLMADMADGQAEIAPSGGYTDGTCGQYQSALIAFYRHHDDHDVDPEEINVYAPEDSTVDERDMFSVDEVQAMREAIDSPRERCLFELLAYTGQRIRVIQTLRVKDVDLDAGVLYINEEADGRKGAAGKRPLLGAKEYVRQWLDYHPTAPADPDAREGCEDYLITPQATGGGTPGTQLTQDTMRYHLRKIADKAGVEKSVHPHVFRHYFTTVAKRDYDMDDAYIKQLRGDAPGSNVMETTYQHLSDDDAVKHAEEKTGMRDPEPEENALTPAAPCSVCGVLLEAGDKACSACGAKRAPDAEKSEVEQLQERIEELEAEREIREDVGALKAMADDEPGVTEAAVENAADALLEQLIDKRSEE